MNTRTYKMKDIDMLVASRTIINSAIANVTELSFYDLNITETKLNELKTRIDTAIQTYIGNNRLANQISASQTVYQIVAEAKKDVAILKDIINRKLKDQSTTILNQLGFNTQLKAVQNGDQEALITLLTKIKTTFSDGLQQTLEDQQVNPAFLNRFSTNADALLNANTEQETEKINKKDVTADAINEFNSIYDKIRGICEIGKSVFRGNQENVNKFTFAYVVSLMNNPKNNPQAEQPQQPEDPQPPTE